MISVASEIVLIIIIQHIGTKNRLKQAIIVQCMKIGANEKVLATVKLIISYYGRPM